MERISLIIPVYNCERYIDRCLKSILTQSYSNLEIILIDDGSTDNSGKICEEYAIKDKRIKVFHKDNGGQSSARNLGIEMSTGNLIGFVDSDDWIDQGMFEYLVNLIEKNKADIANIRCRIVKNISDTIFTKDSKETICCGKESLEKLMNEAVIGIPASLGVYRGLYRRALISDFRFVEGRINEDMVFCYEVYSRASKAVFSSKIFYNYFMSSQSTTRGPLRKKELDLLWACDTLKELSKKELFGNIKMYVNQKAARSYFSLLAKAAFYGIDKSQMDKNRTVKFLTYKLRKNWKMLMESDIPVNRKLLITAFCLNFNLVSLPVKIYKKLR